uniref:SCP domain-containing protein n=1 Tax=Mesocestoides corti TaxID=53468 RepID=A0A5K3FDZ3_MESCO
MKVSSFVHAVIFYNYEENSCYSNCSDYTQAIWATSSQVGCANNRCDNLQPGTTEPIYLMACLYTPAGNIPNMRPYEAGEVCSKCPEKYRYCLHKQCSETSVSSIVLPFGILIASVLTLHTLALMSVLV